ncbi:FAD-binding protein [Nonomuraea sp. NPDC048916]|uniref:FAD-dependent oxidoreductase n=1 Tax=Nonomuraea sp. NPDC048916 TaxID=3154232 RepID=UPI0033DE4FF3
MRLQAADGPGTDGPGTDGPGTDGPGTDGPGTDGPGTDEAGPVADVVVLGTGPAGMAAVAAAAAEGAEVVAVEALGEIGGNCVWSTGYLAFVGSDMQAEHSIEDDVETFVRDAGRMVEIAGEEYGLTWDEDLVRLFGEESAETYRVLTGRGVRFSRFIPRPRQHSIDRMAAVVDPWMFQRAFRPDFESPNVRTLFRATARRLVTDAGGRVTGVVVRQETTDADGAVVPGGARTVTVAARRGVVLATGGYQANPLLRRRFQPAFLADGPYLGVDTCRGDGHLMGQAVGGDLINMTHVPPLVIVSSSLVEDAIAVNAEGRRFEDEAGPYEERVAHLLRQPGRRGWYVFDSVVAREKATLIAQMPEPAVSAPSLEALAHEIGVPADALTRTVREWNAFLDGGESRDPLTGRVVLPPGRRTAATPPFTAVPMVIGVNFVSGGFRVTRRLQVLDVFGAPIPGLFAAGDCLGGLSATADLGGTRISGGFTLGRLAGRAAASGEEDTGNRGSVQGAYLPSRLGARIALMHLGEHPS